MSAETGTAEGDELDILATLVDAYEQKHFPHVLDHSASQSSVNVDSHEKTSPLGIRRLL